MPHIVFKTEWFSIDTVHCKASSNKPYYRLSCNDSVEILAVTSDQKIMLVRQFRPVIGINLLELPSGHVDEGESSKNTIERELKEETGFIYNSIEYLRSIKICLNRINNNLHVLFGKNAKKTELNGGNGDLEVVSASHSDFEKISPRGGFHRVCWNCNLFIVHIKRLFIIDMLIGG